MGERISKKKPMETWLAMNKWVNDGPPFPGATFKTWIKEFYQQDKLVKGQIKLRGRRVDLSNIQTPLLSIAGKKDHICTLPQAEALMDLVSSEDKEFFVLDAGHVGLMTGRGAKKGLWPKARAGSKPAPAPKEDQQETTRGPLKAPSSLLSIVSRREDGRVESKNLGLPGLLGFPAHVVHRDLSVLAGPLDRREVHAHLLGPTPGRCGNPHSLSLCGLVGGLLGAPC